MDHKTYNDLMDLCSGINDAFVSLFSLATYDEREIELLYQEIKSKILEPKIMYRAQIISLIYEITQNRDKYCSSYQFLIDKINGENRYSVETYNENFLNKLSSRI